MRVFQINTVYNTGSTGRIVAQLKHTVEAAGGACIAAYGRGNAKEQNTYKIGSTADMYMHAFLTRITDKTAFYSNCRTQKMIKKIKEFSPDVIHLHNLHGYYLNIEILFDFLKNYGKPVIWTLHDCWAFTGHCAFYTSIECEKWQTHCSKCAKKKEYPASNLRDNSEQNFTRKRRAFTGIANMTIVTPSEWLAGEVKNSFLKEYEVRVIPNGVDTGMFRPMGADSGQIQKPEGKEILLGVANEWSERKGLKDFIAISERVDDSYAVVLVGVGDKEMSQIPNRVIGIKKTNNVSELAKLYSEALVLINPTYEDNFPSVNLEALACGTPVITYRTGGSPEAIDEKTGICVEPGDIDGILEAIDKVRHISQSDCRKRGEEFDQKIRFEQYYQLYKSVVC